MKEVAQLVYETLTLNGAFASVMGTRCFPLFAKENTIYPFTVYNVGRVPPQSKEAKLYPVLISLCFPPEKYTEALDFAEIVEQIFEDLPNCELLNTEPIFNEETQAIVININLQITK